MRGGRLLVVLAFAASAAAGGSQGRSPLRRSAHSFERCKQGDDVDIEKLVEATTSFCNLLRTFGLFTAPSIREVHACLGKVRDSFAALASSWPRGRKRSSMKALLEAEVAAGLHRPRGLLADPSAAMGLLWVRRGLAFWARVFELEAERLSGRGKYVTFSEQCSAAHGQVLGAFHGWMCRRAFLVAMASAPEWDELRTRAALPRSDEAARGELRAWASVMHKLARAMEELHRKLDLEDRRPTR